MNRGGVRVFHREIAQEAREFNADRSGGGEVKYRPALGSTTQKVCWPCRTARIRYPGEALCPARQKRGPDIGMEGYDC